MSSCLGFQSGFSQSCNFTIDEILATVDSKMAVKHDIAPTVQGCMEGGFLGFQETPFDSKTISKITYPTSFF